MSMHRGGKNRAREKVWPGADASKARALKETGFAELVYPPKRGRPKAEIVAAPQLSPANHEKLIEHIAMPEWDKRLLPLFMYRGASQPYRIRALQNAAYAMFLSESESFADGMRLLPPSGAGHLCGLHAPLQSCTVRSIFSRLRGARKFTDFVSKAFTEYVEWMHPYSCTLYPVSVISQRRGDHAWWRQDAPYKIRVYRQRELAASMLSYPFVRGAPRPEHDMLLKVHALIPSRIQGDLRADLCQDMFVAILSGEIQLEQIPEVITKYAKDARKVAPDRWKNVSIDELMDDPVRAPAFALQTHTPNFVEDLCNALHVHETETGIPAAHWNEHEIIVHREGNAVSDRDKHKAKRCDGKKQYKTHAEAYAAARIRTFESGDDWYMNAYQCEFCRQWHYGHTLHNKHLGTGVINEKTA